MKELEPKPIHRELSVHEYEAIEDAAHSAGALLRTVTDRVPGVQALRRWSADDTGGHDISMWARQHPEQFPDLKLEPRPTVGSRIKAVGFLLTTLRGDRGPEDRWASDRVESRFSMIDGIKSGIAAVRDFRKRSDTPLDR